MGGWMDRQTDTKTDREIDIREKTTLTDLNGT